MRRSRGRRRAASSTRSRQATMAWTPVRSPRLG